MVFVQASSVSGRSPSTATAGLPAHPATTRRPCQMPAPYEHPSGDRGTCVWPGPEAHLPRAEPHDIFFRAARKTGHCRAPGEPSASEQIAADASAAAGAQTSEFLSTFLGCRSLSPAVHSAPGQWTPSVGILGRRSPMPMSSSVSVFRRETGRRRAAVRTEHSGEVAEAEGNTGGETERERIGTISRDARIDREVNPGKCPLTVWRPSTPDRRQSTAAEAAFTNLEKEPILTAGIFVCHSPAPMASTKGRDFRCPIGI